MKYPARSPRFRSQNRDRKDVESSSPTMSPSDRPLMYLSSSSESSSFEEEAPMLTNTGDSPRGTKNNTARNGSGRKQKTRFMKLYLPCLAFLVLASLLYFRKEMSTGQNLEASPTHTEVKTEKKDTIVIGHDLSPHASPSPSSSTFRPTLRPSPSASAVTKSQKAIDTTNAVQSQKMKPHLVLHIGPQKTGSTTLQDAWTEPFGMLSQSLRQDHYRYRFIHPSSGFFNCDVGDHGGYVNCEASPKLKGLIQTAKSDGQNLLLSDENLDERFPETLRDVIDDNDWDVTVIVMYRRIHQWLHSWYDQINKTTNKDGKGNILLDQNGHPYRREHTFWPDEGGVPIPSFTSWYKEFTQYWEPSELVSKHRSVAFMNDYKPYFKNIIVHSMHQEGDLTTNFMCDSVPDAHHSCNLLKSRKKELPRDNQSVSLNYDIIAVTAREKGILMTTFKRQYVGSRIEKFVKETNKEIPRVCDLDMIDEIRSWLLDSEQALFSETWSEEQASDLNLSFDSYLESGKICDIDFDRIFADEEWLDFFRSLDNRPHLVLHIGPQKTGSTTLQEVWGAPKELKNIMEEDNFDYYFINPHRGMFDCDLDGDRWTNCKVSETLLQILANASTEKKNLLLSDENLDHRFAGALREAISDKLFRVKVVLVYRRIHRWLPSWYSQISKTANMDSNGNLLRNEIGEPVRLSHTKWPSEGGVHVPNFSDWYKDFVSHFDDPSDLVSNHPSIFFKNAYEPYFEHVEVYDMGQDGDFVTNFMCQMVPEASKTCRRLKDGTIDLPLSNPSVNVEHDILSVQAYEHGLIDINRGFSRPDVVEEVRKYLENNKSSITLPRKCDERAMRNQIHDWLLDSEKAMFPEAWSPSVREDLEYQYTDYFYGKGNLCDVDIGAVMSDEKWIEFFSSL